MLSVPMAEVPGARADVVAAGATGGSFKRAMHVADVAARKARYESIAAVVYYGG